MLTLPSKDGFTIEWETGETRIMKIKGMPPKTIKLKDGFESTSRKEVERKKQELEAKGYKVSEIMQCIF